MKKISYFVTFIFILLCAIFIINQRTNYGIMFGALQFLILFLAMFVLSGKVLKSVNFAGIILVSLFFLSRIFMHYYKRPLFLSDFVLFSKVENWDTILQYKELIFVVLAFLFLLLFAIFGYAKFKKFGLKSRIFSLIVLVLLCIMHQNLISNERIKNSWLATFPELKDKFFNFSMSLGAIAYKSPNFGDKFEYFKEKSEQIQSYETSNLKPNLVLWLSESTMDASLFKGNLPKLSMFENSQNTKFNSLVRVHTYGGGTYKSEFEVLSGLSPDDFGVYSSLLFHSVAEHTKFSLPKILKQNGYKTIVLNPFVPGNYNAGEAYKFLGFDEQYHPFDLGYGDKKSNLWHISSTDMANLVKKLFEKYDEPIFIYVLSMNEHGPYNRAKSIKFNLDKFYDEKTALQISDYYERQSALNDAIESLDKFLASNEKEYVFAYFGDHQGVLGLKENDFIYDHKKPFEITNFVVRGSKCIKKIENPNLSELGLMGGVLLELMQISPDEFFKANFAMRKFCDVIDDCADKNLSKSYKSYIFDDLNVANR